MKREKRMAESGVAARRGADDRRGSACLTLDQRTFDSRVYRNTLTS